MTTRITLALTLLLGPVAVRAASAAPTPPPITDSLPFEAAVFLGCDKLPGGPQAVQLALPTEVAVDDVLNVMARLSCSPVQLGAGVARDTKVKMAPPRRVSAQEAFSILDAAITDAGLSLQAEKTAPAQFRLIVRPGTPADK